MENDLKDAVDAVRDAVSYLEGALTQAQSTVQGTQRDMFGCGRSKSDGNKTPANPANNATALAAIDRAISGLEDILKEGE